MKDIVKIDKTCFEWCSIDTEAWLRSVTDLEITDKVAEMINLEGWLMEKDKLIVGAVAQMDHDGKNWISTKVDNVYNNENDFSSVFQYMIICPSDSDDWFYADECYIAIEIHQGGDVRGNYGPIRVFKCDSPADSGFLDWTLGWDVRSPGGDEYPGNGEFSVGYSSNPTCHLSEHITRGGSRGDELFWSDRHESFVGWIDGRARLAYPVCYAGM